MVLDIKKILDILPHRYPMLLVDRVVELDAYKSIEAYKNVTMNEDVFNGHFPNRPIYPGVMIIEGMAQAGGILACVSMWGVEDSSCHNKIVYFMSIDRAKFRISIVPGDKLVYKLSVIKHKGPVWVIDAKAYVDDKLAAEAELKAMVSEN